VHAHAAQLRVALLLHALAGHRGDASVDAHAVEFAERLRLQREGAGPGQRRQLQHLRRIGFRQAFDARVLDRRRRARRQHLHDGRCDKCDEAGGHRRLIEFRERHVLAGPGQGAEGRNGLRAVVARRGERNEVGAETPCEHSAISELRLARRQRVPCRPVEDVRHPEVLLWLEPGRVLRRACNSRGAPWQCRACICPSGRTSKGCPEPP